MIYTLANRFARYDLGFLLIRLCMMVPVLWASHNFDENEFGEFSKTFHQILLLSTFVLFGAHDRITVEKKYNIGFEFQSLLLRALVASPFVILLNQPILGVAIFLYLLLSRSISMLLLSNYRGVDDSRGYLYCCLGVTISVIVLACGGLAGFNLFEVFIFASASMLLFLLGSWLRSDYKFISFGKINPLKGWEYCLNFLYTSFFIQGVLFFLSFVATPDQYSNVTRSIYLVQVGLIFQGVLYRSFLTLASENNVNISVAFKLYSCVGLFWFFVYAFYGPVFETALFGTSKLESGELILIGAIIWLHTYNAMLAPFVLAQGQVRRLTLVPVGSLVIIIVFMVIWPLFDGYKLTYYLLGFVSLYSLFVRVTLLIQSKGNISDAT